MWLFSLSTVQLRKQLMVWSSYFWLGALMTRVTGLSIAPESMAHITRPVSSDVPELRRPLYHNSGSTWELTCLKPSLWTWNINTNQSLLCRQGMTYPSTIYVCFIWQIFSRFKYNHNPSCVSCVSGRKEDHNAKSHFCMKTQVIAYSVAVSISTIYLIL